MTTDDLIARLEAAPCGSRELSDDVLKALGWACRNEGSGTMWPPSIPPNGNYMVPRFSGGQDNPDPTRSVDDALALARPEGSLLQIRERHAREGGGWVAVMECRGEPYTAGAIAATPALALVAAILRAREASDGQD